MAYRLEYAASNRSKCKGPKPCNGTSIGKGELRIGSMVTIQERQNMVWRHWGCTTAKIISNLNNNFNDASDIDGFEDLTEEDQQKVKKAFEEGTVADEDIPDTARKPAPASGEEESGEGEKGGSSKSPAKSKKKSAPAKKPTASAGGKAANGSGSDKKKKTTTAASKKKKKAADSDDEEEEAVATEDEEEEKPKKKKAAPKKKKAKESEDEDEEEEEEEEEPKPKAKRAGRAKK